MTTFIHLPGRYIVFSPDSTDGGISKKIDDQAERERLKSFIGGINNENNSVIVRTSGIGQDLNELKQDYLRLKKEWSKIKEAFSDGGKPQLLYSEADNTLKTLRDNYTNDIDALWIDNPNTFQKVHAYFKNFAPDKLQTLNLYMGELSVFTNFGIEDQIEVLSEKRVSLVSGGSIVIEQTEALVSIDVNSGRSNQESGTNQTAIRTNLEAADEIFRQLRLRNMGGLVVIDFIDMQSDNDRKKIQDEVVANLKRDKASFSVGEISKFGLLELSRQRLAKGYASIMEDNCPHCNGSGRIPSVISSTGNVLRRIRNVCSSHDFFQMRVSTPPEIASYILNEKRNELFGLEQEFDTRISVLTSLDCSPYEKFPIKVFDANDKEIKIQSSENEKKNGKPFSRRSNRSERSSSSQGQWIGSDKPPKKDHGSAGGNNVLQFESKHKKESEKSLRSENSRASGFRSRLAENSEKPGTAPLESNPPAQKTNTVTPSKLVDKQLHLASGVIHPNCLFERINTIDSEELKSLMKAFEDNKNGKPGEREIFLDEKFLFDMDNDSAPSEAGNSAEAENGANVTARKNAWQSKSASKSKIAFTDRNVSRDDAPLTGDDKSKMPPTSKPSSKTTVASKGKSTSDETVPAEEVATIAKSKPKAPAKPSTATRAKSTTKRPAKTVEAKDEKKTETVDEAKKTFHEGICSDLKKVFSNIQGQGIENDRKIFDETFGGEIRSQDGRQNGN